MDNKLTNAIDAVVRLLQRFAEVVMSVVIFMEAWLREQLTLFGVAPQVQTVFLTVMALFLVLGALRVFVGFIRVAIVCILVLIGLHLMLPAIGT